MEGMHFSRNRLTTQLAQVGNTTWERSTTCRGLYYVPLHIASVVCYPQDLSPKCHCCHNDSAISPSHSYCPLLPAILLPHRC